MKYCGFNHIASKYIVIGGIIKLIRDYNFLTAVNSSKSAGALQIIRER